MVNLVVQLRVAHSFHWGTSHMKDIDFKDELGIRGNKTYTLLRTISELRRYNQSNFFILSHLFQSKFKTFDKPFPANEKLGYSISSGADYLCAVHMINIGQSIQGHPRFTSSPTSIPQAILDNMKGNNNFLLPE